MGSLFSPAAPKPQNKSADQLKAEQVQRVNTFEKEVKSQRKSAAVQASLTNQNLLGNLGGAKSKLGTNPTSNFLKNQTKGSS